MSARVLIVDDALFMRQMLRKILESLGCEVVGEAGDGQEAVEKCESLKPDLITLDLVMPNVDGLEALRRIRQVNTDVKIIVVSAIDQRQILLEALRGGADDYIVKPFEPGKIEAALNRVLVPSG